MDKHIRRTVTITIIETWTITWADGAEQEDFPLLLEPARKDLLALHMHTLYVAWYDL
jgi:hypothetical protein